MFRDIFFFSLLLFTLSLTFTSRSLCLSTVSSNDVREEFNFHPQVRKCLMPFFSLFSTNMTSPSMQVSCLLDHSDQCHHISLKVVVGTKLALGTLSTACFVGPGRLFFFFFLFPIRWYSNIKIFIHVICNVYSSTSLSNFFFFCKYKIIIVLLY